MENYEQKYKEAIEKAKKELQTCGSTDCDAARQIFRFFPELKESEDEKIRKGLITFFQRFPYENLENAGLSAKDAISWLEKQSEKTIPKNIDDAALQYVDTCAVDGEITHDNVTEPYWNNHSIMNAYKAGWLEKQGEQKPTPKFKIGNTIHKIGENTVFPRTIEKIEDGEYVCNNSHSFVNIKFQDDYELVEQKPAWSEEDEKIYNEIIDFFLGDIETRCTTIDKQRHFGYWLKSLKDRVQPQPKQEWSEEDEKMKSLIINTLTSMGTLNLERYHSMNLDEVKNWLKSIKTSIKQEWSEEDSEWYMVVKESILERWKGTDNKNLIELRDGALEWLKSLKPNHWKPSEEQMKAIKYFIDFHRPQANASTEGWNEFKHLESLYNDLKKL